VQEYYEGLDFSSPAGKNKHIPFHEVSTHDEKHGRIADRDYAVSNDTEWLRERHPDWKIIRSIGMVEVRHEIKGEISIERRYYVSSREANVEQFAKAVRAHWGIENSLHYVLGVGLLGRTGAGCARTTDLKIWRS
jgi:hypothetical protein